MKYAYDNIVQNLQVTTLMQSLKFFIIIDVFDFAQNQWNILWITEMVPQFLQ